MDAIETVDWGAYAHFTFIADKYPAILPFMKAHYYASGYVVLSGLMALVFLVFVMQKRTRAALTAALGFVASMAIIEVSRLLVPRRRPPDAQNLLGANDMIGSYPSGGVFLFMLVMICFAFALWPWLRTGVKRGLFVTVATVLTISVALSQLVLAIHFVSDVAGGIVGATIVGLVVSKFMNVEKTPEVAVDS